ncbi:Osmotically-inducible protein OsmY, contains BON domain [Maridesulfovibrio ferrireducens]|uniref:Osmotically-inducible protein OsmY, contains BON domain n=1 Tax=Maridesulfovibrio ferrireducens TaxID=246191 RepID=A0A1G9FT22_9BACT|nr:BON domain-containing protein [Maridesulfovibrio ferrireducens]SDK91576.1 Osmotically-inducible protein OsmY, contains BON domain [Maridesulfovibrio ferrireducens]
MKKIFFALSFVLFSSSLLSSTILTETAHAGFLPYGRMYKAAKDDRAYTTQARDVRLQLQLHKTMLLEAPSDIINISSYVYLEHGFLVGEVDSENQSKALVSAAGKLAGLNGVSYYLPLKKTKNKPETSSALELKLKSMLEPDYPSSKLTIKVVQDVVVVLGVLTHEEEKKALDSLKNFAGVDKIINFIQAPSTREVKRGRPRPLRNLF